VYGLVLDWLRCPDGVEVIDYPPAPEEGEPGTILAGRMARLPDGVVLPPGRFVRYRTERRLPVRYDLSNLEDPIILHFVNARDDEARVRFLSRFGLISTGLATAEKSPEIDWDKVQENQNNIEAILRQAGGDDPVLAMTTVNAALERNDKVSSLVPSLDLSDNRSVPRLALRAQNPLGFMLMETAMVAANGARVTDCEHCGKTFLTGPLTGRRSHAKYCSDRCRVAAMRLRNAGRGPHGK